MKCAMLLQTPAGEIVVARIECPTTARGKAVAVIKTIGALDGSHYYDRIGACGDVPVYSQRAKRKRRP